jgi:tRNA (cmo5U34)-methyltransferase
VAKDRAKLSIPRQWTFRSPATAAAFDAHVRESLPWYDLATGIVAHLARCYVPMRGTAIDVGAATGNVGRALAPLLDAREAFLWAIDDSPEMQRAASAAGLPERCEYVVGDAVAYDYAQKKPDLIVCFLTLMFVPVPHRRDLLARMAAAIRPGGALVVFDKMVPRPGYAGTVAYRLTLAAKSEAGASPADIVAKELSVSGVQRPLSEDELADFLEVFRFGDFAGFVLEC